MSAARIAIASVLVLALLGIANLADADPPFPSEDLVSEVDDGLCPFPIQLTSDIRQMVHVTDHKGHPRVVVTGPIAMTLENLDTGFTRRLQPVGQGNVTFTDTSMTLKGRQILLLGGMPIAELRGKATASFDDFVIDRQTGSERLIDPCRLVAPDMPAPSARTTPAPWDAPTDVLGGIALAGLTPPWFGFVEHIHAHLDVFVDGVAVPVPVGIGVAEPVVTADGETHSAIGLLAPVHTHEDDGVLHVENDGPPLLLTLGDFFDIWMVRLTESCLGSYCADGVRSVRVYVDGELVPGDPREIVLTPAAQVAVVFGAPGVPASVPADYDFPPGTPQFGFPGLP